MNWMNGWKAALLLVALTPGLPALAELSLGADEETGLRKWHLVEGNLDLELIQRLPDQTRGFFLARGFGEEVAEEIAVSCIFQTIVRNAGHREPAGTVAVDLARWRVLHDGEVRDIRLKEPWIDSWPQDTVGQPARLAFRWALFPTRQEFRKDDYNWGMTAFGLPPGSVFDLDLVWQEDGETRSSRIPAIECAPDVERLR